LFCNNFEVLYFLVALLVKRSVWLWYSRRLLYRCRAT